MSEEEILMALKTIYVLSRNLKLNLNVGDAIKFLEEIRNDNRNN